MFMFKFANKIFAPFDREFFISQILTFMTLGRCSYINGVSLETRAMRNSDILVGRYTSLSWDLKFLLARNHMYRDMVSTFHFQSSFAKKGFSDYGYAHYEPAKFSSKKANDHYQMIIGNDVWIGRGATIMSGIKIGSGAIVGANATVTKDVPPYAIVGGNPARIVKYRFDEETIKKFMAIKWWNWDVEKVLANAPLMNDPEKFLEKHYLPELEIIPEENNIVGGG